MLAELYIPRISNDMKMAVQKNHLVGQILYISLVPSKNGYKLLKNIVFSFENNNFVFLTKYKIVFCILSLIIAAFLRRGNLPKVTYYSSIGKILFFLKRENIIFLQKKYFFLPKF